MNPRERLLYFGADSLTTQELLSLIIGGKYAITVAESVMSYVTDSVGDLARVYPEELESINGVGINKACAIAATIELAKRLNNDCSTNRPHIRTSSDVYNFIGPKLMHEKQEHLIALLMNSKGIVESTEIISKGGLCSSYADPREIFSPAIRKAAAGIILVHNHPSGDPSPSSDDISSTKTLVEAGKILGIKVIDHIIIGRNSYHSLRTSRDDIV